MNKRYTPRYVTNENGEELDFEATVTFMDDEIRETLHDELAPCTDQEFFDAYAKAHKEKFGEDWFLTERNPVW